MRTFPVVINLALVGIFFQSCFLYQEEEKAPELPISAGIQVALHITGGIGGENQSIQISDHWQLTSVGRRHGWVRKLDPWEQRELIKAMQVFDSVVITQSDGPEVPNGRSTTLVARGSGDDEASPEEAEALLNLVMKFCERRA